MVKDGRKKEREKKKERARSKTRGKERKKKSSAGFKVVRFFLLVFLSVEVDVVVGRIGFTFLPSWVTLFRCCSACRLSYHCSSPLLGVLPLS